jgi:hypothetical protein
MTTIERVRAYLEKRAGKATSREQIFKVAKEAGIDRSEVYTALNAIADLEDPIDCNIGSWWGVRKNGRPKPEEQKTLWFRWYPMNDTEKEEWKNNIIWFNSLP